MSLQTSHRGRAICLYKEQKVGVGVERLAIALRGGWEGDIKPQDEPMIDINNINSFPSSSYPFHNHPHALFLHSHADHACLLPLLMFGSKRGCTVSDPETHKRHSVPCVLWLGP